jgi:hypothetical protein
MAKIALKVLVGLGLCCECIYLLLHSDFIEFLEGMNPDGSSSITWRSGVVALLLLVACQAVAFGAFRRQLTLTVFAGLTASALSCYWLSGSSLGYTWETHNSDGTFPVTWRSDLVLLVLVSTLVALSFLIRWTVDRWKRHGADTGLD